MLQVKDRLTDIYAQLGIPASHVERCAMPLQPECSTLVDAGVDVFGRAARLDAATCEAWYAMQRSAAMQGVELQLVSAYRSHDYQCQLFERKLSRGQTIEEILQVNAAPGYSEHHSGRAVDVGTPGFVHLEEVFETSAAFDWLCKHAGSFGFRLTFPRDNPYGVLYEPWHWYFVGIDHSSTA